MSTSFSSNGHADTVSELDWQAWMDYATEGQRFPRDQRHACGNPACRALTEALFCSPACREDTEGPDHEIERDEDNTASVSAVTTPLPEARASVTVRLTIAGHADVLFTLRDHNEAHLLQRLEALLQRFPVPQVLDSTAVLSTTPHCPTHGPMKRSTKGKGWYCACKLADGSWCKERRHE